MFWEGNPFYKLFKMLFFLYLTLGISACMVYYHEGMREARGYTTGFILLFAIHLTVAYAIDRIEYRLRMLKNEE